MRIVHVVPTYLPAFRYGGPIFAIHGLCRALAARGHRVDVFTTNIDGPDDSPTPLGVPVPLDGVNIRYFPSTTLRRLFWSPPLAQALTQELDDCAILHLHSVFLWPTMVAARAARRAHIPYLISPRGMLVKDLVKRRSRLAKSAWIELFERSNLQNAASIHVTSALEEMELNRFGFHLPRIDVIPNGVDELESFSSDEVSPDVRRIAADKPILFLGRLSWKKGLDRLLRAFALTSEVKLAIVGTDDEGIIPQLIAMAQDLGVLDRVRFLGRTVLGADKQHLYASARFFVLPSYSENFGNTVLEAMQHGLAVITTPEVGAAQIVRDSKGGFVAKGDPDSLGDAMQLMSDAICSSQVMGAAGRKYVRRNFTWSRVAAQMEDLYAGLASGAPGSNRSASSAPVSAERMSA